MLRRLWIPLVLGVALIVSGPAQAGHYVLSGQQEESTSPRASTPVTFLQINDVYSTVPIDGVGGLARVATLKQQMAAAGKTPVLVIAGDFLSPSVSSSVFKGEQMVAALNAAGLDFATLGNHEFDFGSDMLIQRMAEAKWQWIVSNVIDTNTGQPVGNAAPYLVTTYGGQLRAQGASRPCADHVPQKRRPQHNQRHSGCALGHLSQIYAEPGSQRCRP